MDEEPATPDARKERLLQRRHRLERRLAETALERFGLGDAALEPLRLGEGFTQVLCVSTGRGERFALKLYSPPPPEGGGVPADAGWARLHAGPVRLARGGRGGRPEALQPTPARGRRGPGRRRRGRGEAHVGAAA